MELVDYFLVQVLQPFFFYSVLLLIIACASAYALLKINDHLEGPWKSMLIVAPLFVPLVVLGVFSPSLTVSFDDLGLPGPPASGTALSSMPFLPGALPPGPPGEGMFSVAGALILAGAAIGLSYLLLSAVFRGRVAERLLHIVRMGPEDYPGLQRDVRALAESMDVRVPRLGLVEDLRPNAFTVGWGRGTLVVFSLGLLTLLDEEELKAVAAHELAHVKNRDFAFKTLAASLAWFSFFNPVALAALKASRRERESMADQKARSVIGDGGALSRAIAKVTSSLEGRSARPSPGRGFCFALSLVDRTSMFADHPSSADRMERIKRPVRRRRGVRAHVGGILLSAAVIALAMLLFANLGEVRAEITQNMVDSRAGPPPEVYGPLPALGSDQGPHYMLEGPGHAWELDGSGGPCASSTGTGTAS